MNISIHRREFLKTTSAAIGLAALSPHWLAAAPAKRDIKKAIMYGTIGFKGSVLEKLTAIKAAGFAGVEPTGDMNQDDVEDALQKTGLKAASVCCHSHWSKPLSDPNPAVREAGLAGLNQSLRAAKRYGASSVLLVPGVVKDGVTYEDCWKRSIAEIRKAIPVAEETGVRIAIENVWNNFITKPEQAAAYLEEINSPFVGWHFDIGNVIKYSPPETWIPVIGKRILKLHVKEYSKEKAEKSKKEYEGFAVKLLEGSNNWPAIMKALDDVGYQGWGISEQPGDQTKDADSLKDFSARMDRAFAS